MERTDLFSSSLSFLVLLLDTVVSFFSESHSRVAALYNLFVELHSFKIRQIVASPATNDCLAINRCLAKKPLPRVIVASRLKNYRRRFQITPVFRSPIFSLFLLFQNSCKILRF